MGFMPFQKAFSYLLDTGVIIKAFISDEMVNDDDQALLLATQESERRQQTDRRRKKVKYT